MKNKKHKTRQIAENASLYDLIMEYARQMSIYKYQIFLPPYIISLGCHLLNLWNKRFNPDNYRIKWRKIYDYWFTKEAAYRSKTFNTKHYDYLWLHRGPADLRLHLFFVTPPGYGKSLMQTIFLSKDTGVCNIQDWHGKWKFLPCKEMSNITEAALVGTAKTNSEAKVKRFSGIGEKTPHSIIGVDEASSLFTSRPETFNQGRAVQLLNILDSGRMSKATGLSDVQIQTYLTFWCASQPARFYIQSGSGLDRRFGWELWLPKFKDSMHLIGLEGQFGDIKTPFEFLDEIRGKMLEVYHRFTLRRISWDKSVIKEIKQIIRHYKQSHTDIFTYGKIALGYTFMKYYHPGYTKLTVRMNPELRMIIRRFAMWKDKSFGGDLRLQHLKILIDELHGYSKLQFSRSVRKLGHPAEDLEGHLYRLKTSGEILILKRLERGREIERIYSVYLINDKIMRFLHIDEERARQNKLRTDRVYQHGLEKILWTDRETFWKLYNMRNDDKQLLEDPVKAEEKGYKCWVNKRYYLIRIVPPKGYTWNRYYNYMHNVQRVPVSPLKVIRKQSFNTQKRIAVRKKKGFL